MDRINQILKEACQKGDYDKVRYALYQGADPNCQDEEGWMPIHYAAENGYHEIISFLLDHNAQVNSANSAGFTTYQILMICEHYSPETVNHLICKGANVGTPLHKAILLNDTVSIEDYLARRRFVRSKDSLGNTPLHLAVAVNNSAWIMPLLNAGAKIDDPDIYNTTPLIEATAMGQTMVVGLLLNQGANPEHRDYNGRTALTFAAGNAHYETTELLIQSDVDINSLDFFGNSALHYAFENEQFEIADLLIEHGAKKDIVNEDGKTPIQMAPNF